MKKNLIFRSVLALALILALLVTAAVAETVEFNRNSRVYQYPNANSKWLAVPAGLQCELVSVDGGIAKVTRNGYTAYTPYKHLTVVASLPSSKDDWDSSWMGDGSNFVPFSITSFVNTTTKIYKSPNTSSASTTVPAGLTVTTTAIDFENGWTRIERKGYTAYIPSKYLSEGNFAGSTNVDSFFGALTAAEETGSLY